MIQYRAYNSGNANFSQKSWHNCHSYVRTFDTCDAWLVNTEIISCVLFEVLRCASEILHCNLQNNECLPQHSSWLFVADGNRMLIFTYTWNHKNIINLRDVFSRAVNYCKVLMHGMHCYSLRYMFLRVPSVQYVNYNYVSYENFIEIVHIKINQAQILQLS